MFLGVRNVFTSSMKRSRLFEDLGERPYKRPLALANEIAPDPRLVTGPRLEDSIPQGKTPIPTTSEKPNERSNVAIPATRVTTSTALLDVPHTLAWTKCVPYGGTHGAERSLSPSETLANTLAVNAELSAANPADPPLLEPTMRRPRLVLLNSTGQQHPEASRDQWTTAERGEFHVHDPDGNHFDSWRLVGVVHSTEGEMDPDSDGPAREVAVLTHVDGPVTLINDFCERPFVGDFFYVGMTRTGANDHDGSPVHELFYFSSQHVDMPDYQPKQARQAHASTGSGFVLKSGRKRRPHGWTSARRAELRAMRGRVWRIGKILDSNLMDDRVTLLFCMRELSLDEFWRCHPADAPPASSSTPSPPAIPDNAIGEFIRYAKLIEDGGAGLEKAYAALEQQPDAFATLKSVLCSFEGPLGEKLKALLRASGSSIGTALVQLEDASNAIGSMVQNKASNVGDLFATDASYSKTVATVFEAAKLAIPALHAALVAGDADDFPSEPVLNLLRHAVRCCVTKLDVILMEKNSVVHDALTRAFEQAVDSGATVPTEEQNVAAFDQFTQDLCSKMDGIEPENAEAFNRTLNVLMALLLSGVAFRAMRRSLEVL